MSKNKKEVVQYVGYFQTANEIWDVKKLDTYEKLVYMYLSRCGNQGSKAFPSYNTIADKCEMSRSKAINSVKKLEEVGLLEKQERKLNPKQNKTNLYEVMKPRDVKGMPNAQGKNQHPSVQQQPPSTQDAPPSTQEPPNKELIDEERSYKESKKATYVEPSSNDSVATHIFVEKFENFINCKHGPVKADTFFDVSAKLDEHYKGVGETGFRQTLDEYFENFNGNGLPKLQHFNEVAPRYLE